MFVAGNRTTAAVGFDRTGEECYVTIASHSDVVIAAVTAGRAEFVRLHRAGHIDDETLHHLDLDVLAAVAAKSETPNSALAPS
jgi:CPA1 family monovalent cation:H+ antiporter